MEIDVDPATPSLCLRDPEDFKHLSVRVVGRDEHEAKIALAAEALGGTQVAGHVFVAPETIVALAGAHSDEPAWRASFAAMVEYAATKGWVDGAGRIRMHVA